MKTEAGKPNSVTFCQPEQGHELFDLIKNTGATVKQLQELVVKYKGLGKRRKRNWDRLRLGSKDLGPLQSKLTIHISAISAYLQTMGINSLGRIEDKMGEFAEMKIRQFRKELIGDGFSSDDIHRFSSLLKEYLKGLRKQGLLDEAEPAEPANIIPTGDSIVHLENINESNNLDDKARGRLRPSVGSESESNNEDTASYSGDLTEVLLHFYNHLDDESGTVITDSHLPITIHFQNVVNLSSRIRDITDAAPSTETTSQKPNDQGSSTLQHRMGEIVAAAVWTRRGIFSKEEDICLSTISFPTTETPIEKLYPIRGLPFLPNGWYCLINEHNRVFFVDRYAEPGFKRCFWNPPVPERSPGLADDPGWTRVENAFGRVHWRNNDSGEISYDHPRRSLTVYPHTKIKGRHGYYDLEYSDELVACQMGVHAWNEEGGGGPFNQMRVTNNKNLITFYSHSLIYDLLD
ncbi:hypothetical protein B7463_g5841, partial [Scytalidium lignicola]